MYPQLAKLASIAALVPVSTAECERSFSTMNRVKTALRNRMKTSTFDSLMRIKVHLCHNLILREQLIFGALCAIDDFM